VTVFGFPAAANSHVISLFAKYGTVMDVNHIPGSNWVHIRYSSPLEASRALFSNGKTVGQGIMVGVIKTAPDVIQESGTESSPR